MWESAKMFGSLEVEVPKDRQRGPDSDTDPARWAGTNGVRRERMIPVDSKSWTATPASLIDACETSHTSRRSLS